MTVGYRIAGGTDLDAVFKARTSSPAAATGFKDSSGVDLNNRYQPRGSTTARADTGFKIAGGTDLSQVFMDINAATASTHTLAARTDGSNTGYSDGTVGALVSGSSMTPKRLASGAYDVAQVLCGNITADIYLAINGVSLPPDTDATWLRMNFVGVFSDSGGSTVTKSLTRAGRSGVFSGSNAGLQYQFYTYNGVSWDFIANNNYTVNIDYG